MEIKIRKNHPYYFLNVTLEFFWEHRTQNEMNNLWKTKKTGGYLVENLINISNTISVMELSTMVIL